MPGALTGPADRRMDRGQRAHERDRAEKGRVDERLVEPFEQEFGPPFDQRQRDGRCGEGEREPAARRRDRDEGEDAVGQEQRARDHGRCERAREQDEELASPEGPEQAAAEPAHRPPLPPLGAARHPRRSVHARWKGYVQPTVQSPAGRVDRPRRARACTGRAARVHLSPRGAARPGSRRAVWHLGSPTRLSRRTPLLVLLVGLLAFAGGAAWWRLGREPPLPEGIWRTHGRSEARRIDIATRFAGRLVEVLVREGDRVEAGQVMARLDSSEVEARLREAEAALHQAEQVLTEARALERRRESELAFAIHELERAQSLGERGFTPGQVVDLRRTQKATAEAAIAAARAGVQRAEAAIAAARATVERIRSDLAEYTLRAPKAGRVQYRLAEPGEVLAPGARVVSLLDLEDVYMVVFVPTAVTGRLRFGAEARIVFDAAPRWVVPASVHFVAAEAQFTPRYVETEAEREKLMFRVQVRIPEAILRAYADIVKTGVPGTVYLAIDPNVVWPERLAVRLADVPPG